MQPVVFSDLADTHVSDELTLIDNENSEALAQGLVSLPDAVFAMNNFV